ncbi:type I pantothenate kinase [Ketogulonicigenium robustum]|uniref:Pantothenate kinase n=1 Tax=Ketogulonicigenium robustum TaxID=92947 RepID=A0A1W6NXI2_9RHOB|nr:type I pantothenate kinase [Ketogulonicigenium robustum]ARO13955.1 type I pantothenate kinase [Ketogulonicigenium robustum]
MSPYIDIILAQLNLQQDPAVLADWPKLKELVSLGDDLDQAEVASVHALISRIIAAQVDARTALRGNVSGFLPGTDGPAPFIVGIAGSVAAGKSTIARILHRLIENWPSRPNVQLITTDGFLRPNAQLEARNMLNRKGFPESYRRQLLLDFVLDVKSGKPVVTAPVYSHLTYDIVPGQRVEIKRPDILIIEGINILQPGLVAPFVSDFIDFSIFVDADDDDLLAWYVERFLTLRDTAFTDPTSYFSKFAGLSDAEAVALAHQIWDDINAPNLKQNILPTRQRADLILHKGRDHRADLLRLRRM